MRKLRSVFLILFVFLLCGTSANAYQYAIGNAELELDTFNYSYEYMNGYTGGFVGYKEIGVYSYGAAVAMDQNTISTGFFFRDALNGWAEAYTNGAFSTTGFSDGNFGSHAEAKAGYGYGAHSGAFAGSFAAAYGFMVQADVRLTIQMDYLLDGEVGGDGFGYSSAGSGAILGIYNDCNGGCGADGNWQSVNSTLNFTEYLVDDTLFATLDLKAGEMFTLFAGTAAFAFANDPTGTAPVPEPATMLLLGTGLIGIAGIGRKKLTR